MISRSGLGCIGLTAVAAVLLFGGGLSGVIAEAIPCTESALLAKIDALNDNCSGDKTITFACDAGTVIYISEAIGNRSKDQTCTVPGDDWSLGVDGCLSCPPADAPGATNPCSLLEESFVYTRTIACDGVTLDGENKITFDLNPGCDARLIALGDPYGDTQMENGDFVLRANAVGVTLKNFTYRRFWEGIQLWKDAGNVTIENVTAVRSCDDALSTRKNDGGHVVRDSVFMDGKDKCLQLDGRDVTSTSDPDYDISFVDNVFRNCQTPMFVQDGRYYLEGNVFDDPPDDPYKCHGPHFGHKTKPEWNPVVYLKDNTVDGCYEGMRVTGNSSIVSLGGNTFINNFARGASVEDSAKGLFQYDTFRENGGSYTGYGMHGGLYADGSASLVVGGGSITIDGKSWTTNGQNTFVDNLAYPGDRVDLHNGTSGGSSIVARHNFWGDADPSDQIVGQVEFSPWLENPPDGSGGTGGTGDPPPAPGAVWRTDSTDPPTN